MFERFFAAFECDPGPRSSPWLDHSLTGVAGYDELMVDFAGRSFNGGLYRLHSGTSGPASQALMASAFPELAERVRVFGMDWLGRQIAADFGRVERGEPQVLMVEPGTGEALEIPTSFERFHDNEIVDFREEALAYGFYLEWRRTFSHRGPLRSDQCVAYRLPLFLGGEDVVANLELSDVDVYWEFAGQMRRLSQGKVTGTQIQRAVRKS